jgi:hypothetical protein
MCVTSKKAESTPVNKNKPKTTATRYKKNFFEEIKEALRPKRLKKKLKVFFVCF